MRARVRRRTRRHAAPKIRRCVCNGAKERMAGAGGLMIGGARDPAEARASARAARAFSSAPVVHRKCAACAAEDQEARRSPAAGVIAPGKASAPASKSAEAAVNSLGPGRPLSAPERAFYEPRLDADLSPVRLHENATADTAARAMDASAFTFGHDIAFVEGARQSGGAGLLAHELAHAAEDAPVARRVLRVQDHDQPIPRPGRRGVEQTNEQTIQSYLEEICDGGGVSISGGVVSMTPEACEGPPGRLEGGCDCICELIRAEDHDWRIIVRDAPSPGHGPRTPFDNPEAAAGLEGAAGTGGEIIVPSPNSPFIYGAATTGGEIATLEPWQILQHEMCGHARLGNRGAHPLDYPWPPEGGRAAAPEDYPLVPRQGHGPVVEETNRLGDEHPSQAIPHRGSRIQDPYCGESFYRWRGDRNWSASRHYQQCIDQRREYMRRLRLARPDDPSLRRHFRLRETLP